MKLTTILGLPVLALVLSGCIGATSGGRIGGEPVAFTIPIQASAGDVQSWRLKGLEVSVPTTLDVSTNPNVQFPKERIVWWGDEDGDRRAQVDDIMTRAVATGFSTLKGNRPVNVAVKVNLFHAVTPRARNGALFAWHDVSYSIDVIDAATGTVLASEFKIDADLEALRGDEAREAVDRGQTQRVRIANRVAQVTRDWLASSGAPLTPAPPVYRIKPVAVTQ